MPEPLDLGPIKALANGYLVWFEDMGAHLGWFEDHGDRVMTALPALIAEVERLRREADCWRDATHHLAGKRGEA